MRYFFTAGIIFFSGFVFSQNPASKDEPLFRGPVNILNGGVVDGVVLADEVPLRSKIDYEYVRASDYVWSKRVFSRIDSRELINHSIFFPLDSFSTQFSTPKSRIEVKSETWNTNQTRLSLWTIISRHIMLGDLTVYQISHPDFGSTMDGFSLKYPINKQSKDDFFVNKSYQSKILYNIIATKGDAKDFQFIDAADNPQYLKKTGLGFTDWMDSLKNTKEGLFKDIYLNEVKIRNSWDLAMRDSVLADLPPTSYITSESIVAYYIKEDWYFDKERSVLDKRIIAIAPVVLFRTKGDELLSDLKTVVLIDQGMPKILEGDGLIPYNEQTVERELFWLYFDELRDVLVNYYVYNEKNDAQWMSFDDLFWKRKFSSTIYKVSDKFDRDIEDYKFGVEALYESERVKESIRNWEHDLWNY